MILSLKKYLIFILFLIFIYSCNTYHYLYDNSKREIISKNNISIKRITVYNDKRDYLNTYYIKDSISITKLNIDSISKYYNSSIENFNFEKQKPYLFSLPSSPGKGSFILTIKY